MSRTALKTWLVAYDIRHPRRLRRVHRALSKQAMPLQYSAFSVDASAPQIVKLMDDLTGLLDVRSDDLRAYHVPARCTVWVMGRQEVPEGVELDGIDAVRLLVGDSEGVSREW